MQHIQDTQKATIPQDTVLRSKLDWADDKLGVSLSCALCNEQD